MIFNGKSNGLNECFVRFAVKQKKQLVMAKQRFGINDGYRGTVGTVIGYQWRGKWCLRSRPRQVRNPRTPKQMAARGLFSLVSQLASRMSFALRTGMRSEALKVHRTECNHFMSLNAPCFALVDNELRVDYENLLVAVGPVAPVGFATPVVPAGDTRTIVVPFEKNPLHLSSSGDDNVYLYAWCPETGEGILSSPVYRRKKQIEMTLPDRWNGLEVHLYGFATDYAGRASDSTYIGCIAFDGRDNLYSSHNKKTVSALTKGNTEKHHTYETSNISGPYAGIRWNAGGTDPGEGSQGDARGCPSGGTRVAHLHRD
jgi:hypothetical protein